MIDEMGQLLVSPASSARQAVGQTEPRTRAKTRTRPRPSPGDRTAGVAIVISSRACQTAEPRHDKNESLMSFGFLYGNLF